MIRLRRFIRKIGYKYDHTVNDPKTLKLYWWNAKVNLGDAINEFIGQKLSAKNVEWVSNRSAAPYYLAIGSVIQKCNDKSMVWGSGIISDHAKVPLTPLEVFAVRGPLTRQFLLKSKIHCPEVYGDPALLLPKFITPSSTEKKYRLGIIPHYVDKGHPFFEQSFPSDTKVIDIETADIQKFVDEISACEMIVSSSLHGVIISDAFDIPAHQVIFSDKIKGGNFKYRDYYLSVNRSHTEPVFIHRDMANIEPLYDLDKNIRTDIDVSGLLKSCPFIDKDVLKRLLAR